MRPKGLQAELDSEGKGTFHNCPKNPPGLLLCPPGMGHPGRNGRAGTKHVALPLSLWNRCLWLLGCYFLSLRLQCRHRLIWHQKAVSLLAGQPSCRQD